MKGIRKILSKKNKSGFTLIELMAAVSILLIGILASLSGFISSLFLNESSSNLTVAVNDAQHVLEQVKGLEYSCIQSSFTGCYTLPVFNNLPSEAVAFSPAPTIGSNVSKINVLITWQDKGRPRSYGISTYIAR